MIRTENLLKRFEENLVLNDVSMSIEKGKTTVIIGPSGCGKTVFIKHLIVLLRPTSGKVYYKNKRVDELDEDELSSIRTNFGFLFQSGALFDSLTVTENVLFPIRQHIMHIEKKQADELVASKLSMVGLDGFQDYYPAKLSGGQKKRVALARAIALNPEVILYDEPTTGLDPIRSDIINELIIKLQKELGITSIVVTHDMTSAYKISDQIIMFHKGKIFAEGDADTIRNHPNQTVQQFINGRVDSEDLKALKGGKTTLFNDFTNSYR
ncbi:MAG: ABC transporter ATP-binding protein [Phycisphaerae bacterium]|nr:ABC transporter ATP-binding protein [Phycisphaerae bacterium]